MEEGKIEFDITDKNFTFDNVLIKVVQIKKGDDYLADVEQYGDKPEIGIVIKSGPDTKFINTDCIVLFNKYSSTKYRNPKDREDYYVVREEDIIAY